MHSEAEVL